MSFRNSILAGLTLIREAIRSQNYDPGVAGWTINSDGTAEFADLTVRSSDGSGNTIELVNGEVLLYENGVLVGRLSATIPGLVIGEATEPQVLVYAVPGSGIGRVEFDPNSPAANTRASLTMAIFNEGDPDENISFQMQGPSVTGATDRVEFLLSSQNADGSSEANILARVAGGPNLYVWDRNGAATFVRWVVAPPAGANAALWVATEAAHTGVLVLVSKDGETRVAVGNGGHLNVLPEGSASASVIFANTDLGQTAPLLRLQRDSSDRFVVDNTGAVTTYAGNAFTTFTPTVNNGGTVTWTTRTGWYQRVGKMIFFNVKLVVNANGSGAGPVQVVLPITMEASIDQEVLVRWQETRIGYAVIFNGANSATFDRIRVQDGGATNQVVNLIGTDLTTGRTLTLQGWVREA